MLAKSRPQQERHLDRENDESIMMFSNADQKVRDPLGWYL
jgi:hypothetical protein